MRKIEENGQKQLQTKKTKVKKVEGAATMENRRPPAHKLCPTPESLNR
jgi:hypothetical protein